MSTLILDDILLSSVSGKGSRPVSSIGSKAGFTSCRGPVEVEGGIVTIITRDL